MAARWRDKWIEIRDGVAFVRGTSTTVDEVQRYWKLPGIGAVAIRKHFSHLSEPELGAAVTWADVGPTLELTATPEGVPRRELVLGIHPEPTVGAPSPDSWQLVVFEYDPGDGETVIGDHWESTFAEIQRYFGLYTSDPLIWRDEQGKTVDVALL